MTTSTDYSNRTIDLLMFQGVEPAGDVPIVLGLGDAGEVCTGLQKVSQTFTNIFLTKVGSIQKHPDWGTDFVTALQQGRIQKERDVKSEFNTAAELVRRTMVTEAENNNFPSDETLQTASLQNFNLDFDSGKLTLYIKLTTIAGTSAVIYLPVPVAIR